MSSAKRTPRYVDAIRSFEVVERGMSADVIRLRPEPLGPALPPITEHWPRAKAVPLARRPWQLLLVPPTPGAPTRDVQRRALAGAARARRDGRAAPRRGRRSLHARRGRARARGIRHERESEMLRARLLVRRGFARRWRCRELDGARRHRSPPRWRGARARAAAPRSGAARRPKLAHAGPQALARARRERAGDDGADRRRHRRASGDRRDREPLLARAPASAAARHSSAPRRRRRGAARNADHRHRAGPRVRFVGRKFGFGLVVEIDHGNGVLTRYAHCGSALVDEGARRDARQRRSPPSARAGSRRVRTCTTRCWSTAGRWIRSATSCCSRARTRCAASAPAAPAPCAPPRRQPPPAAVRLAVHATARRPRLQYAPADGGRAPTRRARVRYAFCTSAWDHDRGARG